MFTSFSRNKRILREGKIENLSYLVKTDTGTYSQFTIIRRLQVKRKSRKGLFMNNTGQK